MLVNKRTKRYVYTNQKGGVTKSTETVNNAIAGSQCGKRVLVVDADHGQGNATYALGYTQWEIQNTLYSLMTGDSTFEQTVLRTYYDPKTGIFFDPRSEQQMSDLGLASLDQAVRGPDLLPMNPDKCDGADIKLLQRGDWGRLLSQVLDDVEKQYDEMHLDTNPDIKNVFPKSAVYAATDVVIPTTPENWSVQGMIMLAQFLMQARAVNEHFHIAGVIFARLRYSSHNDMIKITKEEVVPSINRMIQQAREAAIQQDKPRIVQQLKDLEFRLFENTVSESKEYSIQTFSRSAILTGKKVRKTDFTPALELWNVYIELLQQTGGSHLQEAMNIYNNLVDQYEHARN